MRRHKNSKRKLFCCKTPIEVWDVQFGYIVISKLVKTKINSKHLLRYLDKALKPFVLIITKIS